MKKKNILNSIVLTVLVLSLTIVNNVAYANESTGNIPKIIAESAIVMDMDTGEVIASKDADKKMPVASTIKLLTALIFAENTSKTEEITFTEDSLKTKITSLNNFKQINVGDKISSIDLMEAVMILSANDAAYLMAESVTGNVNDFIKMMNDKVKSFGLENTYIVNPSGLESDAINPENKEINISTAYDMAIIAKEAYKNDWIREIISTENSKASVDLSGTPVIVETRNKLLGQYGNIGGKTGNEIQAGRCFVGFFERDGRNLVTVALKSQYGVDDTIVFNDTKTIADIGYSTEKQVYKKSGEVVDTLELKYKAFRFFGPEKTIEVPVIATKDVMYYKNDINDKNIKITLSGEDQNAWKLAGEDIELTLSLPNSESKIAGIVDISLFDLIKTNVWIYIGALFGIVLVLLAIAFGLRFVNSRKRGRKKSIMSNNRNKRRRKKRF